MHAQSPTSVPQPNIESTSPAEPFLDSQHGEQQGSSPVGGHGGVSRVNHAPDSDTPGRLSPTPKTFTASRNRIAEYENASAASPSRKKTEGPAFAVVKKPRKPGDKHSPIADLPNEILTHALAHLSPQDLSAVSLVSRRFHDLVTTPHAWRTAFSRYFPGPDSLDPNAYHDQDDQDDGLRVERRAFTRVTALASWRSEYILRTRLLRSLARGKPVQPSASPAQARLGQPPVASPIVVYPSQMFTTVNHLHATFGGTALNKRPPRFVHGADDVGTAGSSDPTLEKADSWGLGDPNTFLQFSDRFPGDAMYGLAPGNVVGVPNSMDVSQPYGMIHGEGSPGGFVYYRYTEEMRGHFLKPSSGMSVPSLGIPQLLPVQESICSVWIAKSSTIPSLTDGLIGLISGSSLGVLTTYSLGPLGTRDQRFARGEVTARWVLSPGVPIIAIAIDDQYSVKRQGEKRAWAVALNALGEVFYLTKLPKRSNDDKLVGSDDEAKERLAWSTGRSVYWTLVEPSRRTARPNPYSNSHVDGSYSPRTSWNGMYLSEEQMKAETYEIEDYINRKPKEFQRSCLGWNMRRLLEVDFAGDDGNQAGEAVFVFESGLDEDSVASAKRFVRFKVAGTDNSEIRTNEPHVTSTPTPPEPTSLFGGPLSPPSPPSKTDLEYGLSLSTVQDLETDNKTQRLTEEWRLSSLSFGGLKSVQITAHALDGSTFATLTSSEDPLLNFSGQSTVSSPSMTPLYKFGTPSSPADVPGQRARFIAVGTMMGSVLVWDARASLPTSAEAVNTLEPIRIIHTESPQISCIALSSLYLVHGGNDGLVQAWDVLASSLGPIRRLNSRFASRARRRLVQAQASVQGVGINLFAAGAICLDPDPTVLRGMVSIGTHLLYWSFSSSAADQYKSHKRRLRRVDRGTNVANDRFANVGRGNIKGFIANEQLELERESAREARQAEHLAGRFGTELLGSDASEEEILAYAQMLSEEALAKDWEKKTTEPSANGKTPIATPMDDADMDPEIAEAIRLSLAEEEAKRIQEQEEVEYEALQQQEAAEGSNSRELTDLEFALQLSLAEEQSRLEAEADAREEFPALSIRSNKGKGKQRRYSRD
ncbi:hypothetical protein E4T49_05202 [Aureobasidium sp. EXF-10728]|nr:hypothetical protein E4T49_05202 [Aureobasidium sp. EXF-10728]